MLSISDFKFLWREYAIEHDCNLDKNARKLKRQLLVITGVERLERQVRLQLAHIKSLQDENNRTAAENAELRRRAEVAETKIRYRELLEGDYTKITGAFNLCITCTEVNFEAVGQEHVDGLVRCKHCRHAMAWAIAADEVENQND